VIIRWWERPYYWKLVPKVFDAEINQTISSPAWARPQALVGWEVCGGDMVAEVKRILLFLPNSLLQEIDGIIETAKLSRSQFVREAICVHGEEYKRKAVRDMMAKGYQE